MPSYGSTRRNGVDAAKGPPTSTSVFAVPNSSSSSASTPLLQSIDDADGSSPHDDHHETVPDEHSPERRLGIAGTVFLILNKMIGTGIFSTPASVFAATGSVGLSILLWIAGGVIIMAGLSTYLEFGLAIPRSGGEKNYLERVYRRPPLLATCMLASQMVLLGFSAGNALAFGRYVLYAVSDGGSMGATDGWLARVIGVVLVIVVIGLHSVAPRWGIRLFNTLGVFKVGVLAFIVVTGFAALAGYRRVPDPHNFDRPFDMSDLGRYGGGGAYAYASALLSIIYSFKGWENANYVLSEVRNPRRTLMVAGPLAVGLCTVLYVLATVAYFAAIPADDLAASDVIVAGLFFRNVFGDGAAARVLPIFVAVSNLGNVLAVSFAHARFNQELAREGILPFSRLLASSRPFNSPAASLILHGIITIIILVAPPPGPAYNFIINLYVYPGTVVNIFVTGGLLYLHYNRKKEGWLSPWHTPWPVAILFLLSNVFLMMVPFWPPAPGWDPEGYPYYIFPVVGVGVLVLGAVYWLVWTQIGPWLGSYRLEPEHVRGDDGITVVRYKRVKKDDAEEVEQ
ncbi:high affinity methionine permease [Grosmannia clavigera kw1407]|uniref:High affinity methionine permease n=1 Tax=Grosmannia clavigera (strain kw1407 / UAMH 11150) TaxID=655863 RepID=F0X883_GROCL|nr:high affinity methionine permease [Grosmannia clavigera kw1407]EFX06011.1 high affinity methionine permease [Grosmannia clavigera kw1407]